MAVATKLKFGEFMDLLLARLYELEQREGGNFEYFDLDKIAGELKDPIPPQWVFDAAQVLEARNLANCAVTFEGASAHLTGQGRLYVEEERGTGIIKKFHESPQNYVVVTGNNNQVNVADGNQTEVSQTMAVRQSQPLGFQLLEKIKAGLQSDDSLGEHEKQDYLTDLALIESQLKKREPNRRALASLLAPLSEVASVASFVVELIRLVNAMHPGS
jgi:hypothetical protein